MPPMGLNLFIAWFRFNKPVPDLYRMVLPFIAIFVIALLATTYIPSITLMMIPGQHATQSTTHGAQTTTNTTTNNTSTTANAATDAGAPAATGGGDCELPREDESFEDFQRRCENGGSGGGDAGAQPTAPSTAEDCELPRESESYEAFSQRCHVGAAEDSGVATESSDAAAEPSSSGDAAAND